MAFLWGKEMADFKADIADASQDLKTIEDFVNLPAGSEVNPRLLPSVDVGTLSGIRDAIFEAGGLPAIPFKTKELMTASVLVDGKYAQVTDDTTNNGLYVKAAGAWVKSEYDPVYESLLKSKEFIDTFLSLDSKDDLILLVDKNNAPYLRISNKGDLYLSGVTESVQEVLNTTKNILPTNESNSLFEFRDKNDALAVVITESGRLIVNDVLTPSGSLNAALEREDVAVNTDNIYNMIDGRASSKETPLNKVIEFASTTEALGYIVAFSPVITRLSKDTFYIVFEFRAGGDYDDIQIVGKKLIFNDLTNEFTISDYKVLAKNGIGSDGVPYTYLNPTITLIESGVNKGRLIVHFNYMTNPAVASDRIFRPYFCVSDDLGGTFTAATPMADKLPQAFKNGHFIFGPGHGIQLKKGKHKDRVILPCYRENLSGTAIGDISLIVYSDDGCNTYKVGAESPNLMNLNEWQAAEIDNGDVYGIFRWGSGVADRYTAVSKDGGLTFSGFSIQPEIKGAGTKTGLVQCENNYDYSLSKLVAIAPRNPDASANVRIDPHVWVSYDNGATFPYMQKIGGGICQYADIVPLTENKVLALYGGGTFSDGDKILGHVINLNFLIGRA